MHTKKKPTPTCTLPHTNTHTQLCQFLHVFETSSLVHSLTRTRTYTKKTNTHMHTPSHEHAHTNTHFYPTDGIPNIPLKASRIFHYGINLLQPTQLRQRHTHSPTQTYLRANARPHAHTHTRTQTQSQTQTQTHMRIYLLHYAGQFVSD